MNNVVNLDLSIIIPTHRRPQQVVRLLESLLRQPTELQFEICVIANLDEPGLQEQVVKLSDKVSYHVTGSLGVNKARNRGLEIAKAPVVLFLDDDCEVTDETFLDRHIDLHQRHPEVLAVGGRYSLPPLPTSRERAYHILGEMWLTSSRINSLYGANLLGGNSSYKRARLWPRYSFNEAILIGGSEAELNQRLVADGEKILLSDELHVVHHQHDRVLSFLRKAFRQGVNKSRFLGSHPVSRHYWQMIAESNLNLGEDRPWAVACWVLIFRLVFTCGEWWGFERHSARRFSLLTTEAKTIRTLTRGFSWRHLAVEALLTLRFALRSRRRS